MTTVADLASWMESFAPRSLAESWDNVGLLLGDPSSTLDRVMTCLTVTPTTAAEAISERAGAIVSHHPILFKAAKSIRADRPETSYVWSLARNGVAVLSPHTSFDNTRGGINELIADRIGLRDVGPLRKGSPAPKTLEYKLIIFVPRSDREKVLDAAFAQGGGRIGLYDECSFSTPGVGTFFGNEGASPTVGQPGRRETAREWKVELVCPSDRLARVLAAIREAHSYEEPAIDVVPLVSSHTEGPGAGRIGLLAEASTLEAFASKVGEILGSRSIQYAGDPERSVSRVAICCGAGDDFLPDALTQGADVLLTGEARFHRALEAEATGIGLVLAGHHATERPGVEALADRIAAAFPEMRVWASRTESDPLRTI